MEDIKKLEDKLDKVETTLKETSASHLALVKRFQEVVDVIETRLEEYNSYARPKDEIISGMANVRNLISTTFFINGKNHDILKSLKINDKLQLEPQGRSFKKRSKRW